MAHCRIILADDHELVRKAVKMLLMERAEIDIAGEAGDGIELLNMINHGPQPDAVIVDISMPRLSGIDAIREIRKMSPAIKVLVLTMNKDENMLALALGAGADGYLLKEDMGKELFPALEAVLQTKPYISSTMGRKAAGQASG